MVAYALTGTAYALTGAAYALTCAQVDSDGNRYIDKSEMEKFVTSYGFDVECFKLAFDQSTKYPGEHGVLPELAFAVAFLCNCAHPSIHLRTLSCFACCRLSTLDAQSTQLAI